MTFFKKIAASIYNPAFYRDLPSKPFKSSIKYFFMLILLLSLIITAIDSVVLVPHVKSFFSSLGTKVVSYYPEDLQVTIRSGVASTNVAEPYVVKMPKELQESRTASGTSPEFDNLLIIDTKHDFNLTKFNQDKTFALLTRDSIVYKDKDGKVTIQMLKDVPDVIITRNAISHWIDTLSPILNLLPFLMPIFFFVVWYVIFIFKLVYFFIAALLIWRIVLLKKVKITYKQAYQFTIHAFTLSLLLDTVSKIFSLSMLPLLPTLLLIIVILVNVKKPANISSEVSAA